MKFGSSLCPRPGCKTQGGGWHLARLPLPGSSPPPVSWVGAACWLRSGKSASSLQPTPPRVGHLALGLFLPLSRFSGPGASSDSLAPPQAVSEGPSLEGFFGVRPRRPGLGSGDPSCQLPSSRGSVQVFWPVLGCHAGGTFRISEGGISFLKIYYYFY